MSKKEDVQRLPAEQLFQDEIDALMLPDTRIGAFGPLFTIIMITSILLLSIEFFRYKKDK